MNFPQLPTDNLYKFLALSGVAIYCLSLSFISLADFKLANEINKYDLELNKQLNDQNFLQIKLEQFAKVVERSKEDIKTGKLSLPDAKNISDNLSKELEQLIELKRGIDNKYAEVKSFQHQVEILKIRNSSFRVIRNVFPLLGIMLAFIGFVLWYFMVQKYQDIILKREALKNNNLPTTPVTC